MRSFKFNLNEDVAITVSGETGAVIGRAEYASAAEYSYLVRYKAANGQAMEVWWTESALQAV